MSTPTGGQWAPPPPADIQSTRRNFSFAKAGLFPPSNVYIQPEDTLRISVISSLVAGFSIPITWRILDEKGQIIINSVVIKTPAANTLTNFDFVMEEGFLLSLTAGGIPFVGGVGQAYATVSLVRLSGTTQLTGQLLTAGYISANLQLSWPGGNIAAPQAGPGKIQQFSGSTPALGTEINEVVPGNQRWRIQSFSAQLQTSAGVANRIMEFVIDDGAVTKYIAGNNFTQTASLAKTYTLAPGVPTQQVGPNDFTVASPVGLLLTAGWRIRTSTTGLQAGDQWAQPQYVVEQWEDL